jgi:hypothetical protein
MEGCIVSAERYEAIVEHLCEVIGLPDTAEVLQRRRLEIEGFDVRLDHVADDPDAMYVQFDYGIATAGRTLRVFRLMLESNLLVYAMDQAQLGLDPDTGTALLILRAPLADDIDGEWLADTLVHYAEHGRYWRDALLQSPDDMINGIASGDFAWIQV